MIVHPSEQELLLCQLQQVFFALAVAQQQHQARVMRKINLGKETDLEGSKSFRNVSQEIVDSTSFLNLPE